MIANQAVMKQTKVINFSAKYRQPAEFKRRNIKDISSIILTFCRKEAEK
jgi:hypothetical protein